MRRTVVCERPLSPAIGRVDRWVASGGVVWSVRSTTYATRSSPTVRGRPDRGGVRQSVDAVPHEAAAPFADRPPVAPQFRRNLLVRHTLGAAQDDAAAFGQGTRHLSPAGPAFQEGSLLPARDQGRHRPANSTCHPGNLLSHNPMTIPYTINFKFWILAIHGEWDWSVKPRTRDATLNHIAVTSFMPNAKHTYHLFGVLSRVSRMAFYGVFMGFDM